MLNIKTTIKNNNEISIENYNALKNKNTIIYDEKEYRIKIYLDDIIKITRENSEYLFDLNFIPNKTTVGSCLLKETNTNIELAILTDYVIIEENLVIVKYKVLTTDQDVTFKLEVLK